VRELGVRLDGLDGEIGLPGLRERLGHKTSTAIAT
jgi:hypothetical protein